MPFSKMVYDQTAVSVRYPTPETPGHVAPNGHPPTPTVAKKKSPAVRKSEKPKHSPNAAAALNRQAHAQNAAKFEIVLPTKKQLDEVAAAAATVPGSRMSVDTVVHDAPPVPINQPIPSDRSTPAQQTSTLLSPTKYTPQPQTPIAAGTIAIELPRSGAFNKNDYLVVPDEPDAPLHLSARRKGPGGYDDDQDVLGESLGIRQRSDAAFHDLRRCIQSVYEAEEHLHAHRSNNEVVMLIGENEPALTPVVQRKIHTLLERAIALNCFQQAPLDDLLHIIRLSESALKYAEGLDIKITRLGASQRLINGYNFYPMSTTD